MNTKQNDLKKEKNESQRALGYLFGAVGNSRGLLVLSVLITLAIAGLTLYVPFLVGRAINWCIGVGQVNREEVSKILFKILLSIVASGILRWFSEVLNNRITYNTVRDLRETAFNKLQRLPFSYLDCMGTGDTVSRIVTDIDTVSNGLLLGFSQLVSGVVTIVGTLVFLFLMSPAIAGIVLLVTPLSLFASRFIIGKTHRFFKKQSEVGGEETAFIDEMISNQKTVQAFGNEGVNRTRFAEINTRFSKASLSAVFFSSLTNPVTRFVNSIVYAAVALTGGLLATRTAGTPDPFTVGALTACLAYANQYTKPFNEITGVITELQTALASLVRVSKFMDAEEEAPDSDAAQTIEEADGRFSFSDVSFSYRPDVPLLTHINFTAEAGQKIAIVGPTGCGKTTLINLLLRFYEVTDGEISLDGTRLKSITRSSLRNQIGMVLQDSWIRFGSVHDNIALGKPDATREEVIEAAKAAYCDGFIRRLPNGYDTVLPENGGNLSQGQRQLLSIARVMLCRPPVILLDEATSSVDTMTEVRIQAAFAKLTEGKTSFIVAHRLSTIREADIILVMKDGNIIETGRHADLLEKGGFYASLYAEQFGGQDTAAV